MTLLEQWLHKAEEDLATPQYFDLKMLYFTALSNKPQPIPNL
jgi:hypothetical protein